MAMTPAEFSALMTGWQWRHGLTFEETAVFVCQIINTCSMGLKHGITPEQMLGRPLRYLTDSLFTADR
jgi:hypothetical protein